MLQHLSAFDARVIMELRLARTVVRLDMRTPSYITSAQETGPSSRAAYAHLGRRGLVVMFW
jgi:hypothetical protein